MSTLVQIRLLFPVLRISALQQLQSQGIDSELVAEPQPGGSAPPQEY